MNKIFNSLILVSAFAISACAQSITPVSKLPFSDTPGSLITVYSLNDDGSMPNYAVGASELPYFNLDNGVRIFWITNLVSHANLSDTNISGRFSYDPESDSFIGDGITGNPDYAFVRENGGWDFYTNGVLDYTNDGSTMLETLFNSVFSTNIMSTVIDPEGTIFRGSAFLDAKTFPLNYFGGVTTGLGLHFDGSGNASFDGSVSTPCVSEYFPLQAVYGLGATWGINLLGAALYDGVTIQGGSGKLIIGDIAKFPLFKAAAMNNGYTNLIFSGTVMATNSGILTLTASIVYTTNGTAGNIGSYGFMNSESLTITPTNPVSFSINVAVNTNVLVDTTENHFQLYGNNLPGTNIFILSGLNISNSK